MVFDPEPRSAWLFVEVLYREDRNRLVKGTLAVQVNSYTTGDQFNPSIALDDNGTFITVWRSDGSSGTDTDSWSVQGLGFQISFFFDGFESGDTSAWSNTVP